MAQAPHPVITQAQRLLGDPSISEKHRALLDDYLKNIAFQANLGNTRRVSDELIELSRVVEAVLA